MTLSIKRVLSFAVFSVALLLTLPAFADSQARIVRLSAVDGNVQVDRHSGQGLEKAILNMPLAEGMVVDTSRGGRAEVEFEDGDVVRLTPGSQLVFQALSLLDSGAKVTTVAVDRGTVYFEVQRRGDDQFTVVFDNRSLPINKSARFRLMVSSENILLSVFKGEVAVPDGSESLKIKKGQEAALVPGGSSPVLVKSISPNEFDRWNEQRSEYHERYYAEASYKSYPYYGRGDLSYYGSWYSVPGYGSMWRPSNVGYTWDPFHDGAWAWYPGAGYTFVSINPWGWLPYRYGSWVFVPSGGWYWSPYGNWNSWRPIPVIVNSPPGYHWPVTPPHVSPRPPTIHVGGNPNPPANDLPRGTGIVTRRTADGPPPRVVRPPNPMRPPEFADRAIRQGRNPADWNRSLSDPASGSAVAPGSTPRPTATPRVTPTAPATPQRTIDTRTPGATAAPPRPAPSAPPRTIAPPQRPTSQPRMSSPTPMSSGSAGPGHVSSGSQVRSGTR